MACRDVSDVMDRKRFQDLFAKGEPAVERAERILEDHLQPPALAPPRGILARKERLALET
jgi:hypothetical protein